VDVQVAAVPALGGGVEQAWRVARDGGRFAHGRVHVQFNSLELQASGASYVQWLGRHREGQVMTVEERPVVDVPFGQQVLRKPAPAGGVGDRPARATRRQQPQLRRWGRADRAVDAEHLVAAHHGEHGVAPVELDCLDRGAERGHSDLAVSDGEEEVGTRGRVDDDIDAHPAARDRGAGGSDVGAQAPVLIDPHHDDARRDLVTDHRTDGVRPVAGGRECIEDRPEQGEAHPPEEVDVVVAPVPTTLVEQPAVVGQRLHRQS